MPNRDGFTVIELLAATALLGVVVVTFAPLMAWINAERQAAYQRQVALEEACNVLERISTAPWEAVDKERIETFEISSVGAKLLRDHRLVLSIDEKTEPVSKRLSLVLDWKSRSGERVAPVRLTTWLYAVEGNVE